MPGQEGKARSESQVEHGTKKVINNVESVVEDHLAGFVAANPHLRILQGYRVVVRSDIEEFKKSGKASLVCGGGSGHEPVFAGFVGEGALSAAIAGSVFTSPPPSHIMAALQTVQNPNGTVVFVINYTGDRMNFGLAMERTRAVPKVGPMRMVILGEDTALTSTDQSAGRRGLAGCLVVLKIAGALSEAGKSVDEIGDICEDVASHIGTIGLSLSSCSLPGRGPIFYLEADEMELGLGVHGEPGVRRMKLKSAQETVAEMLGHMTTPLSETHLELEEGGEVVVLLNNLGGLSQLEMNIVSKEVIHWLDAATNCAGWPKPLPLPASGSYRILPEMPCPTSVSNFASGTRNEEHDEELASLSDEGAALLQKSVQGACGMMILHQEDLNDLDRVAGDGDTGATMMHGAKAIVDPLMEGKLNTKKPGVFFQQISQLWENSTGGTSGCIYAILMATMADALKGDLSKEQWIKGLKDAVAAVQRYGKAQAGDRTLLDALIPAVNAAGEGFQAMIKAAEEGAASSTGMKAKAGRASYVAASQLTAPDPGAQAVALWLKGAFSELPSDI